MAFPEDITAGTLASAQIGDYSTLIGWMEAVGAALNDGATTYAAAAHTHAISDTTGLQTAIDGKAATTHTHAISDTTGLQTAIDGKAATSHTHAASDVTGLGTAATADTGTGSSNVILGNDARLTDARTPTTHSHAISDTTGLQAALDGAGGLPSQTGNAGKWVTTDGTNASWSAAGVFASLYVTHSASNWTVYGAGAGNASATGVANTVIGASAGTSLTTSTRNVIIGYAAGNGATSGVFDNVVIGNTACQSTAGESIAVGTDAMKAATSYRNIAIGTSALRSATGGHHVALGHNVGYDPAGTGANATTSAIGSVLLGYRAGQNTSSQKNYTIALGWEALVGGTNAIAIGKSAQASGADSVAIGASVTTSTDNEIKLGGTSHYVRIPGQIKGNATTDVSLVVKAITSQSANAFEVQNTSGTALMFCSVGGNLRAASINTTTDYARMQEENSGGVMRLRRSTGAAANPGSNYASIALRDGTTVGTLKLVVIAGAGGAETTILDNIPQS